MPRPSITMRSPTVQHRITGATSAGIGAIVLTASAAASMKGKIASVLSGTNFTVDRYVITAVTAGVSLTLSANVTTGVGANGVIEIGAAVPIVVTKLRKGTKI